MVITDIAPLVQAQIKMCPMPMIFAEVKWAANKFLEDTRAWTSTIMCESLVPDSQFQKLKTQAGSKVSNVYDVRLGVKNASGDVGAIGEMTCVKGDGDFDYDMKNLPHSGTPRFWRHENERLRIWPAPTTENAGRFILIADVCLTIDGKNPVFPDWIDIKAIAHGALGQLYALASQDWFDPNTAAWYDEKFAKSIAEARIKRIHGGNPGSMVINAPEFGGYF